MNLIKSLIPKYFKSNETLKNIFFRTLSSKYRVFNINKLNKSLSISDSFLWRTDQNFKTIFRFSDLLRFFYKLEKNNIEIIFFSKNYELIKTLNIKTLSLNNELEIDKKLLGIEDYGIFQVYHKITQDMPPDKKIILLDKSYVGFSKEKNFYSFLHGNIQTAGKELTGKKTFLNFVDRSVRKNKIYQIQNNFEEFDKTELIFTNPSNKRIVFFVNNKKFYLDSFNSTKVELQKEENIVRIKSNCNFLRPIIFNYKRNFFDVYHS